MANKQINELTEKSDVLVDDDLILVWDSEESGSEKTKKVPISSYISAVTANTDLYVATTGSDSTGDGTSGNPWASVLKAYEELSGKFMHNITYTINVADGTYNNVPGILWEMSFNKVTIKGNVSTPSNVVLNYATGISGITMVRPGYLKIEGIKFIGYDKAEWLPGVSAQQGGVLSVSDCILDEWGVGAQASYNGFLNAVDVTCNNCNYGTSGYMLSRLKFTNGTLSNNIYGAAADLASQVVTQSTTYTNNSTGNTVANTDSTVTVV